MRRWVISDTHFGHEKLVEPRGFLTVEAMNECMIENWKAAVQPRDTVYHLGDVVMNRRYLSIIADLPGRKILVKGNHDIFPLKDYLKVGFEDIRSCVVRSCCILTHVPVHPSELERFSVNVHGHTHDRNVCSLPYGMVRDERYQNVSVEQTAYAPVDLELLEGTHR